MAAVRHQDPRDLGVRRRDHTGRRLALPKMRPTVWTFP